MVSERQGILIVQGSNLRISGPGFSIDTKSGEVTPKPITPSAQVDFWPYWVRIAIDQVPQLRAARASLLQQDEGGPDEARAVEVEMRNAMIVIAAVAFSLEAFATAVQHHGAIDRTVGQNSGTSRRIAEILRRAFDLGPPASFKGVRTVLATVFRVRNLAVHPPADFQPFQPHPVTAAVPRAFAAFTYENAEAALRFVFDMLVWCTASPRLSMSTEFRTWCEGQQPAVERLLDAWAEFF